MRICPSLAAIHKGQCSSTVEVAFATVASLLQMRAATDPIHARNIQPSAFNSMQIPSLILPCSTGGLCGKTAIQIPSTPGRALLYSSGLGKPIRVSFCFSKTCPQSKDALKSALLNTSPLPTTHIPISNPCP